MKRPDVIIASIILALSTIFVIFGAIIAGTFGTEGIAGYNESFLDYFGLISLPIAFLIFYASCRRKLPAYFMWLAAVTPFVIAVIADYIKPSLIR